MPHDPQHGASSAHASFDPQSNASHSSDDQPFDLAAYVHTRLNGLDYAQLARQLGYNNIYRGAQRLHDLATKPVLGLDEPGSDFDLRFTTIGLIDAVCRLDISDAVLLQAIHDKCHELKGFYQREERAATRLRVITEYQPKITSWGGGLMIKAQLTPTFTPYVEGQAPDEWLRIIKQQIISHFKRAESASAAWGRILGYEYLYRQDAAPIAFDTHGALRGAQSLLISRCSTRLGESEIIESIPLEPLEPLDS